MAAVVKGGEKWIWKGDGCMVSFPVYATGKWVDQTVANTDCGAFLMYGAYYLLAINKSIGTVCAVYTLDLGLVWVSDELYRDDGNAIKAAIKWVDEEG